MISEYELKRIEGIISVDFNSAVEMRHDLFAAFEQAIKSETDKIKNNFSLAIFKLGRKRKLKSYIRYHQQALIRLEGQLLKYADPERIISVSQQLDKAMLCQYVYNSLEELLAFVSNQFPKYMDQDAWLPENYRVIVLHELKVNIDKLKEGLDNRGFDGDLVVLALQPFNQFLKENNSTYRRAIFLRELQKELFKLIHDPTPPPATNNNEPLQWLLFTMNYNPVNYFQYCTRRISLFLDGSEDNSDKIKKLALVHKLINQYPVRAGYIYDQQQKTLKEQLTAWISEETAYLEKEEKLTTTDTAVNKPDAGVKVKTDLSVAQLAFFLRIFIEFNLIRARNINAMIRVIAKFFQTRRADSLSEASLENKYYNPESGTRQAVRNLLLQMANYIAKTDSAA